MEERLPYARDELDPLLDAGQTIAISDVRTDPRVPADLRLMQEESGRLALTMIPMMVRSHRMGLVVLSYPGVHRWTEDQLRPYRATAAQLAIAIDHRLQQNLLNERSQQLAVLQERQRLARELHDSVTQLIFSTTLIAQSISTAWKRDPQEGQRRVDRLLELSQTALREMRALLFELQPPEVSQSHETPAALTGLERIRHYGMTGALRLLAEDFSQEGIRVQVEEDTETLFKPESGIKPIEEAGVYRIVQEALNNAVKHSRAHQVVVRLRKTDGNALNLSISDDGVGFSETSRQDASQGSGLGMKTMRERAESMGGSLRIDSSPGAGTTIEVLIPLKEIRA
jgi:signal transduction histidine kinase